MIFRRQRMLFVQISLFKMVCTSVNRMINILNKNGLMHRFIKYYFKGLKGINVLKKRAYACMGSVGTVVTVNRGTHSIFHYSLHRIATSFSRPLILGPASMFRLPFVIVVAEATSIQIQDKYYFS